MATQQVAATATRLRRYTVLDLHHSPGHHRLWEYQLRFHFEKAFRQSPQEFTQISSAWEGIFRESTAAAAAAAAAAVGAPGPSAQPIEQGIEIAQQPATTDNAAASE